MYILDINYSDEAIFLLKIQGIMGYMKLDFDKSQHESALDLGNQKLGDQ